MYARVYGTQLCRSAAHLAPQSALSRSQLARPARCHFASNFSAAPAPQGNPLRHAGSPRPARRPPASGPPANPCPLPTPAPTAALSTPPVFTRAFPFRPSPRRIQGDADKMTMEMVSTGTKSAEREKSLAMEGAAHS
ncbi:hypothetical protein B0H16DRAFT_1882121 [Mycena metata]|uniref:Uncharacterized protein n=1 Tax=Mycena metata TaxID=1033252 RepID=A0AAD7JR91_9AGAR|nr:hypothetical protein B0H16DRAFT_1882121 [Mycena metata]